MRYTEARMTDVAALLLEGLDENAVDFRPTYDGSEEEPVVLPGAFPNLLANGSSGIAVGMATSIPPHNAFELAQAALKLIALPDTPVEELVELVQGPDFPTGGIIVETRASILESYRTGRGGFRVRARWATEDTGRGTWVVVVTEIPYQVAKSRLIEKLADLINEKRLPLVDDIRDESAEDVRVVIVPKSRNVDPALMMESLFKLSELENRIPLNMNVLSHGQVPNVLGLREVLKEWLDHRKDVLVRRSTHRLLQIEKRLEILGGLLVAYLNLDEVIRIIRYEDEPKQELIKAFALTDAQAEAILNMRLRNLRKLEEFEIRKEHDELMSEAAQIRDLLASDDKQWKVIAHEIRDLAKRFGPDTPLGRRRSTFANAPDHAVSDMMEAMIEREPITVVVSQKGWIRALKGHLDDFTRLEFKTDDKLKIAFKAETTDKIIVFSTGGRFFTLEASKLPGGRGAGEPIRIQVDMDQDQDVLAVFVHKPDRRLLIASKSGRGFIINEAEVVAQTRKGKQVLNVGAGDEARICVEAQKAATHVAVIGDNRKFLVFPAEQIPEMQKGSGVKLQAYKDGGIADIKFFIGSEGLTWTSSSGASFTRSLAELTEWIGLRAQAGRLPPRGFPATNRFDNA
jgi:topoisomerase-4 subunit A